MLNLQDFISGLLWTLTTAIWLVLTMIWIQRVYYTITGTEVYQHLVPEYNIRDEIYPQYLRCSHQQYQQNLPDQIWYILIYIPVLMRYMCRWYYLNMYGYTYRIRIMINSDNDWYKVIWYVHKKMMYSQRYSSIYDICAQMILPEKVCVHNEDENN